MIWRKYSPSDVIQELSTAGQVHLSHLLSSYRYNININMLAVTVSDDGYTPDTGQVCPDNINTAA